MPAPKHILWITTDHLRWDGLGAHNPAVHTPNLDQLARGGVDFARCYGQNPLCMPSRASFMTGLYPCQTGVTGNGYELPADCPFTAPRVLKPVFSGAQFGKLHFQAHQDRDLDPRARHDYGFDILNLAEEPGCYEDAYMTWLRTEHPELVPLFRLPRPTSPMREAERSTFRVLDAPWQASFSGFVATLVERHFTSWGGPRTPQFVHAGFYAPHPPLNPTREMMLPYLGRETPAPHWQNGEEADKPAWLQRVLTAARTRDPAELLAYRRHFHAMVTGVDLAVGAIVAALRRVGLFDDTLIIFASDHGDFCGDHRLTMKSHAWYEEVARLPLLLHWPRGLAPQSATGLTEMVDVLPTILGLCGLPVPAAMAGRNLAPDLLAGREPPGREDVYAVHGDDNLLLRTTRWKYLRHGRDEILFDLDADPREYVNRAADPACTGTLSDMRERALVRHLDATRSVLPRAFHF